MSAQPQIRVGLRVVANGQRIAEHCRIRVSILHLVEKRTLTDREMARLKRYDRIVKRGVGQ